MTHAREAHGLSERRACTVIGAERSSVRYRRRRTDEVEARRRLRELAAQRRRFGWRRLKILLDREGVRMNHKKLRRLYREEGLSVKRRRGRRCRLSTRTTPCGSGKAELELWTGTSTTGRVDCVARQSC